jgi:hypothetical protein
MYAMNPQNKKMQKHTYYNNKNGVSITHTIALVTLL